MPFSRNCVCFWGVFGLLLAGLLTVSAVSDAHDTGNVVHTHTVTLTLRGVSATWVPTAGETLTLTASLSDPGNALSSPIVTFELKNVSNWKGTRMNSRDVSTSPDFKFFPTGLLPLGNQQPNALQGTTPIEKTKWTSGKTGDTRWVRAECPDKKATSFQVKIKCEDYAAYGELTATVSDGAGNATRLWGRLSH